MAGRGVVVPTKVLMHQWLEELVETLGVPADDIGWLGDGHKDGFEFSVDAEGCPFTRTRDGRTFIESESYRDVASFVHREKGGGTVTVNDANHAVTYLGESLVFAGVVEDPEEIEYEQRAADSLTDESEFSLDELDG